MVRILAVLALSLLLQACAATKIVTAPVKVVTGTADALVDAVD